ncbi:MAG: glutamate racemase [Desulfobulbaceae bacterium]|nr:glutamate racemase [Desulfobulbaceae bacterium]
MIGIFDSGVGGMTVAKAVEQTLPDYRLIYFGDLARTPYGSKSPETITDYARQDTEFLLSRGAKLIIIACNTAASIASDVLRREFDVPIFEVITPAVAKAVATSRTGRIGVIGTRATINSNVYEQKIKELNSEASIFSQPCPLLVPLVEEGWLDKRETKMILRRYLAPLKRQQVDTLVLGCTHYPLLNDLIQPRVGKRTRVIDSSQEVAADLKGFLAENPALAAQLTGGGDNLYYVSDVTQAATATARRIFDRPLELIKVTI